MSWPDVEMMEVEVTDEDSDEDSDAIGDDEFEDSGTIEEDA